ncbi:MAG: RNase adapter RapZ [Thermotoga sp.]|nr:MAG: RNase adapter RapZ [Thermotoga sp.]
MKGRIIVITGISGAGKTSALDILEDFGFFCVDNIPPEILNQFCDILVSSGRTKLAVVVDSRSGDPRKVLKAVDEMRKEDYDVSVIFLDSSDEVILKRYAFTRRPHPFDSNLSLEESIKREREFLEVLRERSDFVLDTSSYSMNQLRNALKKLISEPGFSGFTVNILSFSYKNGIPMSSDIVVDTRILPNPYYVDELKDLKGYEDKIVDFFSKIPLVEEFYRRILDFVLFLLDNYKETGRLSITVSIGCTGGRHRSVYIAERLGEDIKKLRENYRVVVEHRDLG